MRPLRLVSTLLLISLTGFVACHVYDDSLLMKKKKGSGVGPVDPKLYGSGIGWWSDKEGNCVSAGMPTVADRPKNAGGADIPPVTLALRSMALGALGRDMQPNTKDPPWKSLGFDLDGLCTNSDTCHTTGDIPVPCHQALIPADGHDCRDNTFGRLEADTVSLPSVSTAYGLSNDGFNCAVCRGDYNFLFRISQWNGKPDDSQVRVDLYPSPGMETPEAWKCQKDDPNHTWRNRGCWKPKDKWTLQPGTYNGTVPTDGTLPDAKLSDPAAYVRGGYIVAQLPDNALFWFPGDNGVTRAYPLKMQGGIVVGKLGKNKDGFWAITDGTIAGRATTDDLIEGFRELGLCPDTAAGSDYEMMLRFVRLYADLLSTGAIAPTATCNALSVGIGFNAEQASFGGTVRAVTPLPGCPPSTDGGTTDGGTTDGGTTDGGTTDGGGGTTEGGGGTGGGGGTSGGGGTGGTGTGGGGGSGGTGTGGGGGSGGGGSGSGGTGTGATGGAGGSGGIDAGLDGSME